MEELYFAYGSNLNLGQMAVRCPQAGVVGKAVLEGYELAFRRGVLTILPKEGGRVNGLLWRVNAWDELTLDRYEGYPHLYTKELLPVRTDSGPQNRRGLCYDRALLRENPAAYLHLPANGFGWVPHGRFRPESRAASGRPGQTGRAAGAAEAP